MWRFLLRWRSPAQIQKITRWLGSPDSSFSLLLARVRLRRSGAALAAGHFQRREKRVLQNHGRGRDGRNARRRLDNDDQNDSVQAGGSERVIHALQSAKDEIRKSKPKTWS